MADDARSTRREKNYETDSSRGKQNSCKLEPSSVAAIVDTSGLRRSPRGTPSKKNATPSPSSTRKSKRLEKQTPTTTLIKRKYEGVENANISSPLRRSERGRNHSLGIYSGSGKIGKSSAFSDVKQRNGKKENTVEELTLQTIEVDKNGKNGMKNAQVAKKRMDAHTYRAMFKRLPKKVDASDHVQVTSNNDKSAEGYNRNCRGGLSEKGDGDDECSQSGGEELGKDHASKALEESNYVKEISESNVEVERSDSNQQHESDGEALTVGDGLKDSDTECVLLSSDHAVTERSDGAGMAELDCAAPKNLQPQRIVSVMNLVTGDVAIGLERGNERISFKRKINSVDADPDTVASVALEDTCTEIAIATASSPSGCRSDEICVSCSKRRRVDLGLEKGEICSCKVKSFPWMCNTSLSKDREESDAGVTTVHPKSVILKEHHISAGSLGIPEHNVSQSLPLLFGCEDKTIYASTSLHLANKLSEEEESYWIGPKEGTKLHESQKSLYLSMKPEIVKLCEVLQLPEDVKGMVEKFLKYLTNNHHVDKEPVTILQAFQISLCWTAASLLKHRIDHKESLGLAKRHLKFSCRKEEADYIYSMLRCLKTTFLYHTEKCKVACCKEPELSAKDVSQKNSSSNFTRSATYKLQEGEVEVRDLPQGQGCSCKQVVNKLSLEPEFELAQKDLSRSIKIIRKKCEKQMSKLLEKQQEEKEDLDRKYREEIAKLQNKKRTELAVVRSYASNSILTDNLKSLDNDYAQKIEELKCQKDIRLKDLEAMQLTARNKLQEREVHWVEALKSWAQAELLNARPSDKDHPKEGNIVDLCSEEQSPDVVWLTKPDGEVRSEVHETVCVSDCQEEVLPVNLCTPERQTIGPISSLAGSLFPIGVPMLFNCEDGKRNAVLENASSCEQGKGSETLCSPDGPDNIVFVSRLPLEGPSPAVPMSNVPDGQVQLQVPGIASCSNGMGAVASGNQCSSSEQISNKGSLCVSYGNPPSEVPESSVADVAKDGGGDTSRENGVNSGASDSPQENKLDGVGRNINKIFHFSDNITGPDKPDREVSSTVPETAPSLSMEGSSTTSRNKDHAASSENSICAMNQHNGVVFASRDDDGASPVASQYTTGVNLLDEVVSIVNQMPHSLDNITGSDQQGGEVAARVPEPVPSQLMESYSTRTSNDDSVASDRVEQQTESVSTSKENNRANHEASDYGTGVDQPDGLGCINNQMLHSLENIPISDPQGEKGTATVQGTAPAQFMEGVNTRMRSDEFVPSNNNTAGVNMENGVVFTTIQDSHSQDLSFINSHVVQPATTLAQSSTMPSNQVLHDESSPPAITTRLANGHASGSGEQTTLQQVETPLADSFDCNARVTEPLVQQQLTSSVDCPLNFSVQYLPSTRERSHPCGERHIINQISQPPGLLENRVEISNQPVLQSATCLAPHLPIDAPVGGLGMPVSDTRNASFTSRNSNRPAQNAASFVPQMPLSYHDPLQSEMERIHNERDQSIIKHDETKLRLKSDCDKEIEEVVAQIRKNYEIKLQEVEAEFLTKKKDMDENLNKVLMNKILAEAFRSKCMDTRVSTTRGLRQAGLHFGFRQTTADLASSSPTTSIAPVSPQASAPSLQAVHILSGASTRPPHSISNPTPTSNLQAGLHCGFPWTTADLAPSPPTTSIAPVSPRASAPFLHAVHLLSGTSTRPPHIISNPPPTLNLQGGCQIRARAPHLRPYRHPSSLSATNLSSLPRGMPSQPELSNPFAASSLLPQQPTIWQPPPTYQSGPHNRVHQPETAGGLPTPPDSSLSALALLVDVENQTAVNPCPPSYPSPALEFSNLDPLLLPEFGGPISGTQANTSHSSGHPDMVCLSDED
ncbi:helicase protein MOM1-like [Tripterygium wilfordii]|uniref:Helicase protein MOM1-like n=2 Tax=Tripterygium wilfordii TaxID=458696 RepID=A0A7J7DZP5_TRIWF|nr:helicase protein MOM1-like isoform X2 [Tripterygium wilfordii]XP_038723157.1 helicase protein MOM1-like isoform X2 [Tripterygium wilfordii]KAF5751556.1 helicase protein MOM1-like [Tripterygium wilfordii]